MSIKQVWEVIKDYQCAELQMVQKPALAVWNHQQAIIDKHQKEIDQLTEEFEEDKRFLNESIQSKDTQIENLKHIQKSDETLIASQKKRIDQLKAEKEKLKAEKEGLQQKITSQIETLQAASQSVNAYTERERNILQSQVDDLEGLLRGEHE